MRDVDEGGFVVVPSSALMDPDLSHTAFRVLCAISSYGNKERLSWPSTKLLANKVGLSERTVQWAKAELVKQQYLEVHLRQRPDGSQSTNLYRVRFDQPIVSITIDTAKDSQVSVLDKPKVPKKARQDVLPAFEAWYSTYPRRIGRGAALRAYKAAIIKGAKPKDLLNGATEYAELLVARKTEKQFIPHPATWLNGERWLDEDETSKPDDDITNGAYAPRTL